MPCNICGGTGCLCGISANMVSPTLRVPKQEPRIHLKMGPGPHRNQILVDGEPIGGVKSVRIESSATNVSIVTLEIYVPFIKVETIE